MANKLFTADAFVKKLKSIAQNNKTLYVYACFGSPMTASNKERMINHSSYNAEPERRAKINAASSDTFGFDCVNLIKGVLWGWNGTLNSSNGGAVYNSNGVPDTNADGFINLCTELSTNFNKIEIGEAVHMSGHIGVYIGNGLVVEATPIWADGVQITGIKGLSNAQHLRTWENHGKIPWIDYQTKSAGPSIYVIAAMCGNWWVESGINPGVWENLEPVPWTTMKRGYGIGQWTNTGTTDGTETGPPNTHGRLYKTHEYLSKHGYPDDSGVGQLNWLLAENHWTYGNKIPESRNYKNLREFLNTTDTDITKLTHSFNASWEGVKNDTWNERVNRANDCLSYIQKHYNDPNIKQWITGNRYLSNNERYNNAVMVFRFFQGVIPPEPPKPRKHKRMPLIFYPIYD